MTFDDVVTRLERGLRHTLPGAAAQARLAPIPRREWPSGFNPARIRNAAGLLLVFPATTINAETAESAEHSDFTDKSSSSLPASQVLPSTSSADPLSNPAEQSGSFLRVPRVLRSTSSGDAHIVLTVRGATLRHGGQISLPGGVVEPGETFEQAALREAHEEIALATAAVRILGALTPLDIPVSGFRLHPVVGVTDARPALAPADGEVAHILEIPVDELVAPANFISTERERDGVTLTIPAFHVRGREIWGATAMVVAEFLALLGWSPPTLT